MASNPYCEALGIRVPALAAVTAHPEASTYRLMIVALLEEGHPLTLAEVAQRFAQAGVAPAAAALASLKRCRPARPPVHRDGDRYTLDPHDDDLDLLVFILGLRPPRAPALPPEARESKVIAPLPGSDVPLRPEELAEAWRDASLYSWSAQRVAICILDAHRRPMAPADLVAFVKGVTEMHPLHNIDRRFGRPTPIQVLEIVAGSAPGWENPWARAVRCRVLPHGQWDLDLVDENGRVVDDRDVQLARLGVSVH